MTLKLRAKGMWTDFRDALAKGEDFTTHGALRGEAIGEYGVSYGRLDRLYWKSLAAADYVVFSYATPIAWRDRETGEWTVPDERYSVTTSQHQSKIATAVSQL